MCPALFRNTSTELRCGPRSRVQRRSLGWPWGYSCSLPGVVIRSRSDGTAAKYRLVLHEVQSTTGEDRAVGDQQVFGDASIGDHNKELVAHPNREEWAIGPRPGPQGSLGVATKDSVAKQWAGRKRMPIFVYEVSPEDEG